MNANICRNIPFHGQVCRRFDWKLHRVLGLSLMDLKREIRVSTLIINKLSRSIVMCVTCQHGIFSTNVVYIRLLDFPFRQRQFFVIIKVVKLQHFHLIPRIWRNKNLWDRKLLSPKWNFNEFNFTSFFCSNNFCKILKVLTSNSVLR